MRTQPHCEPLWLLKFVSMGIDNLFILIGIGLAAGMLSGMFGVGGGVIIVPALVYFLSMTQHQAQGTSLALMLLPIGILAVWNYYKSDAVNWKAGLIIAVAFVIGGYFGSKLSLNLSEVRLKQAFGVMMIAVAVKMIFFSK